jgi:L-asparaginase
MRLAVLADIHGNLPALEAVLADVQQHDVDGIIIAGDLIGGGPHSLEVVRLLRSLGSWMIRGNNEDYFLAYETGATPAAWRESYQWAVMRWSYHSLDRETLDFIASLPEQRVVALDGTAPIRVVHGSLQSPSGRLFPDRDPDKLRWFRKAGLLSPDRDPDKLELALEQMNEPVLVCGHTHIPWNQEEDGRLALNPGAVSGPLNGDVRAQYALLTWQDSHWQTEHLAVPYDLDQIRAAFRESGLLAEGGAFARACLLSIETGQNVAGYFVSYVYKLAAEAGFEDCDVVPDDVWDRAVATFNWSEYEARSARRRSLARSQSPISNPQVAILTTGGTIAMQHDTAAGGAVPTLGAADFIAALPAGLPELRAEELVNLPSSHFTLETLQTIRERVAALVAEPEVVGVVVTHGTDTLEETAYLLDLTVPGEKPVALTGAMRTASDVGYEGYANLLAAVRVAAAPQARGLGTVAVFNNEIHAARHVTKMHTLSPATFQSPGWGPAGRVEGDAVIIERQPKRHVLPWRGLEPNVGLLKLAVGMEADSLEDALARDVRGLVIEALGGGRVPTWWLPVIERARTQGVTVVIASRCPSGRVWDGYGYPGAYRTLADLGCLFAEGLNGQKARIKLMVVLAAAQTADEITELWNNQTED